MEKYRKEIIITAILLILGLLSATVVTKWSTATETHAKSVAVLDEKKEDVLKLTGAAMSSSAAITLIPGDVATPIAEKLADLSGYFLIVLCAIYLEKYLLALVGYASFRFLIPLACGLGITYLFVKKEKLLKLSVKFAIFALALYIAVPASVGVSNIIENAYEDHMSEVVEETEKAAKTMQDGDEAAEGESTGDETEIPDETGVETAKGDNIDQQSEETEEKVNWWDILAGKVSEVKDNMSEVITNSTTVWGKEMMERIENVINNFVDALALMIITSCVIPILVLVLIVWSVKAFLEIDLDLKLNLKKQ
ncbi:MAG: hypothetical protein K6D96_02900 [Acetatifactor sp.]|nr:hypothetical protein [Acetatifactor sp.]